MPPAGPMYGAFAPHPPAPLPRQPRRRGRRWLLGIPGAAAGLFALFGVLVAIAAVVAPTTMTVRGSAVIYGWSTMTPGTSCSLPSAMGRPVSIFDADGRLVGSSSLAGTNGIALNQWNTSPAGHADGCSFSFMLTDVDSSSDFYRVALGTDITDSVGFSRYQLETSGAHITYR